MVDSDGSGVICGAGEVDWMAQVCLLLCACADLPGTQLACLF